LVICGSPARLKTNIKTRSPILFNPPTSFDWQENLESFSATKNQKSFSKAVSPRFAQDQNPVSANGGYAILRSKAFFFSPQLLKSFKKTTRKNKSQALQNRI
jgi:hypothetical protein